MRTKVSIVEDNGMICTSFERVIGAAEDMTCVSASRNAEHALKVIPVALPDVVLMDVEMPGMSGIECTMKLKRLLPKLRILMLTAYNNDDVIFSALKAGANGYLLKRSSSEEILRAIRDVKEGGAPMTAEVAARVVESFHQAPVRNATAHALTPREAEILGLLAQGYVAKEIADQLNISYGTVRDHLGSVYEKLHVRTKTEAVIRYLQG